MATCLQIIIYISLLFNLNLSQTSPPLEHTMTGNISCGESVSGYASNCVDTCFVCGWFIIPTCCWFDTTRLAYEFTMPPSGVVTFSTCNSMGIVDGSHQEAISLWHKDSYGVWVMIDGQEFQNESYCNADGDIYPRQGECTLCQNGAHETWAMDFLNPGETYYIQIWIGPDDQHYQIDMECSHTFTTSEQPLVSTPYLLSTPYWFSTIPSSYKEGVVSSSNPFSNSSAIVMICAAAVVLCCVAALCIVIKCKLKSESKVFRILSLPQQAAPTTHAIQSDSNVNDANEVNDTDEIVSAHNTEDIIKVNVNRAGGNNEDVNEVKQWFESEVELPQYFQMFVDNGFDSMKIIVEIEDKKELEEIGVDMKGHQKFIMKEIEKLKNKDEGMVRNAETEGNVQTK